MEETTRHIDSFFIDAVNCVYKKPNKKAFIMDGAIGVGKSTNFTFEAPYDVACHVKPLLERGKLIRRSEWVIARESENTAVNTLFEIFQRSRFPPSILYAKKSPVIQHGINPTIITVSHDLPDKTRLEMHIECYGFKDTKSLGRLKSRSFLGGIAPEMQTMPFDVMELMIERCGGRSAPGMIVQKEIEGRMYTLSGVDPLTMVFSDMNIPVRPHAVYEKFYDNQQIADSEYEIITPPSPILPKPIAQASAQERLVYGQYQSRYEDQDVIWLPNPDAYWMTAHYEEYQLDQQGEVIEGERIPWSGYNYWLSKTVRDESYIRRLIIGRPDRLGGKAAVYKRFDTERHKNDSGYIRGLPVYAGLDPGIHGGWIFFQLVVRSGKTYLHAFKEFTFDPTDGYTSRQQFEQFVLPYMTTELLKKDVEFTGDPYMLVRTSKGDGEALILSEHGVKIKNCVITNQDTEARISNLGYFIQKELLTVNATECPVFFAALSGGYQYPISSSGVMGNKPMKNEYSHVTEAAQYVAANLYKALVRKKHANSHRKTGIGKLVSA